MQQRILKSIVSPHRIISVSSSASFSSYGKVDDLFLSKLSGLCEGVTTNKDIRYLHGNDESSTPSIPPDVVAFPKNTETVQVYIYLLVLFFFINNSLAQMCSKYCQK